MSKFVRVATELRDVALVKQALDDLDIRYTDHAEYHHRWTGTVTPVRLLLQDRRLAIGLREAEDGTLEVVGDDMGMRAIKNTVQAIQQRYAYHTVLARADAAGFELVEERTGRDNVIRLTVRRWS